ncbi:2-octaprenyl-6-methoxyphenyl hydroxylase [Duganella sp. Leaf126]|uniref:FAD-dependent monooxygenase n=1 Tax=Duganella sp. Leaf126 TaxID=1736266 RepID=UPI00070205BE|nr:FAD-dependent monooxygenase [Duganella sp. Leaf126]KQQ33032.1 2-octaprenyl-6-methoxyphenyl hydroxylase [Duganella sp. Leaf126]
MTDQDTTSVTAPLSCDVAICGAGPAGMALAALLVRRGMAADRIALIDARTLDQSSADPRSLALSWGSRQILEEIGAWPISATEIREIHVSRRGQFGRSMITAAEQGVPALGYVTRYGNIVARLGAVVDAAGVATRRPARVEALDEFDDHVVLTITDLATGAVHALHAGVVVQAEGGLFNEQQDRAQRRDYGQTAIIAQVRSNRPQPHRAYERFTDEGPLALLPQDETPPGMPSGPHAGAHLGAHPGTHWDAHPGARPGAQPGSNTGNYAMVWCVRPARAQQLLALDDQAFLAELGAAFGERVGRFTAASPRLGFALGLNADARTTARTVAIGNAAQTLHPVAGQGLNLGLRDVTVLARLLAQGATPAMLAQFAAARRRDRTTTVRLTDTMARIFANDSPAQALLGMSLAAIDVVGPARSVLAELMMYGRR